MLALAFAWGAGLLHFVLRKDVGIVEVGHARCSAWRPLPCEFLIFAPPCIDPSACSSASILPGACRAAIAQFLRPSRPTFSFPSVTCCCCDPISLKNGVVSLMALAPSGISSSCDRRAISIPNDLREMTLQLGIRGCSDGVG